MKAIIISVNPPHAGNLVDGFKTIEWRTKPLPECKAYIYETKKNGGSGKVIGEVVFFTNRKCKTGKIDIYDLKAGMVDYGFIVDYAANHDGVVYANECKGAVRYDKPKELSEFYLLKRCNSCKVSGYEASACQYDEKCVVPAKLTRPPQSWQFVEEL